VKYTRSHGLRFLDVHTKDDRDWFRNSQVNNNNSTALVRGRTIQTERPPLGGRNLGFLDGDATFSFK
jgi:hypothetical protein